MKNYISIKFLAVLAIVVIAAGFAMPASADMTTSGYYDQFGIYHVYQTYSAPTNYYGNNAYYGGSAYGSYYGNYYGSQYNIQRINRPPAIWSSPSAYATEGSLYISSINAYDSDNDQMTFSLVSGPSGMTVSPISGQIRWDATAGLAGKSFPVTVSVTDNRSAPVTQTFTVVVHVSTGYAFNSNSVRPAPSASTNSTSGGSAQAVSDYQGSAFSSIFGGSKKVSSKLAIADIAIASGPMNVYEDKPATNCNVLVSWSTAVASAGQVVYGTVSQPSVSSFKYSETVAEGTSYQTAHQVKLGCLENATYYLRVIAFSDDQRVVSEQQVIAPFVLRMAIPAVSGSTANINQGGASAVGTLGKIIANPFVLIVILGVVGYLLFVKFFRKEDGEHGAPSHHAPEPALQIPHH